ncbi:MAG: outer membrane protein assembly factor BamD [Phycisphaeraceae bacterium]|nr:outer membrane protein assembly factor BamD [Phycisphaeraceae bacterium]
MDRWTRPLAPLATALALALAAPASAQSAVDQPVDQPVYELDDSGAWVQTAAPEPGSDAAVMAEARRLIVEDRTGEAIKVLDQWLAHNQRSANPYVPEALLLRGDAKVAADNEYSALIEYEAVTMFPESPHFVTALEREYEIALRYLNGLRRKFLGFRIEDARPTGEELMVRIQERLPGSRLAEQAAIELADYYYRRRDMPMASDMYEIFTRNFPDSPYRRWAMQRWIYSSLARYKGPRHDTTGLVDARNLIEDFRDQYPQDAESAGINEALLTRVDESLGDKQLETAMWYLRTGDEPSARYTLRRLVRDHPQTVAAVEALRLLRERGWDAGIVAPIGPIGPVGVPGDEPATGAGEPASSGGATP